MKKLIYVQPVRQSIIWKPITMFRFIQSLFKLPESIDADSTDVRILKSSDISHLSIDDITRLSADPLIRLELDADAMDDAYHKSDIAKLDYLHKKFGLTLRGQGDYHIDKAVEEGSEDMAKFLIQEFKCKPSLYAKQMALVGGHSKLFLWVDTFGSERNSIALHHIHLKMKGKELEWDKCVPEFMRYIDVRSKL